jgi:uncharacterized protein
MFRKLLIWLAVFPAVVGAAYGLAQNSITFERSELTIETAGGGTHRFDIELALTEQQKSRGLMFRTEMAADAGMLFVYSRPQVITMWMRNTELPLDMLFIGPDGRIAHIAERAVPRSDRTISSRARVTGVLELNGGTARRLGIAVGDRVLYPAFSTSD